MNKQIKATILSAIVALGSATGLLANSNLLTPNTLVTGIAQYTNSGAPTIALDTPTFSSVDENGYVYEYILSNFTDNPWSSAGGLTFVYRLYNDASSRDAIRGLSIGGWAGAQTRVAIDYGSGSVNATSAYRSANGDVMGFDFAVPNAILAGGNSGWLLIYSDATSYQKVNAGVIDGAGANVSLYSANLPDGGTTAMMLGLGLLGLGLAARRNKRA